MFLVETLLNQFTFTICTVKTQKHWFPFIINHKWYTYSCKSSLYDQLTSAACGEGLQERTKCTVVTTLTYCPLSLVAFRQHQKTSTPVCLGIFLDGTPRMAHCFHLCFHHSMSGIFWPILFSLSSGVLCSAILALVSLFHLRTCPTYFSLFCISIVPMHSCSHLLSSSSFEILFDQNVFLLRDRSCFYISVPCSCKIWLRSKVCCSYVNWTNV